jgi:hypothetical protein
VRFPAADIQRVADEFERYDSADLVASLGALQLLPANASALGRLGRFAGTRA